jgi:hypothetical protein
MYLTEVTGEGAERELMMANLQGLWQSLQQAGIPFKAHWGKINFIDADFVRRSHRFAEFKPYLNELFLNPYLRARLPAD